MNVRIFNPLKHDHPLIKDGDTCPICKKKFFEGQRTTLIPVRMPLTEKAETVEALAAHANCVYVGAKTKKGPIIRIKDGDGSPLPVVTEQGQFTLEEVLS